MLEAQTFQCNVGGRDLIIETGKLAGQANAAVNLRYGDTVVLVTAGISSEPREGIDFLPLTIEYEERLYAAGKIPGGFIRREGRPSEQAILACRLTDRPIRPLLPKGWRNDIQLIATVLSADQENDPDILAVIGSSAALSISEVPFDGPVSAVHVGYINGELVLNPTLAELENSQLDLVVASTSEAIVMLEAGAKEVPEELLPQAIQFGHEANQAIIKLQEQLRQACGKPKVETPGSKVNADLAAAVASAAGDRLTQVFNQPDKEKREQALSELKDEIVESLEEKFPREEVVSAIGAKSKAELRANILKGQRLNGRGLTEVRPISCEVGLLPRTHGSALFTRGQTQVLTITTLGSTRQEQQLDGLGIEETKRFIHHYNFPPFSTGEVKRVGSTSRREIGHGALAERALLPVLPEVEEFPYTIRLVSEVLSSSGSTSMGSTCAGSLSLMDAGIPVKGAVSGIAMGLVTGDNGEYVILTDIEGIEDAYGDMDFKIAGTKDGITAVQMDIKLKGISLDLIKEIINQSREARFFIMDKMQQAISASRPEVSRYAPRMHKMMIDQEKIGSVIGTGGKTIRSIIEETKTTIDISNDGTVLIGATDEEAARKAIAIIESLTKDVEIGSVYTGKVTRIFDFGAMVEFLPGKEGLVHISELADYRVGKVEDVVKVDDEVMVKAINIDNMGRVNLSKKAVFEDSSQPAGDRTEGSSGTNRPPGRGGDRFLPRRPPPGNKPRYSDNKYPRKPAGHDFKAR
ncbi:polyribonucleotide nucleotidyltransferase [Chloroflexota bacterium]